MVIIFKMKHLFFTAFASAIKISEGGLLSEATSKATVTKMVLADNSNFVGYLIEEPEAQNLAEVDSEYRFNTEGKVVSTSFLSLDLLTIAQVLGISNGKTWGTKEYDSDIYSFMKELRSQNEQLIT